MEKMRRTRMGVMAFVTAAALGLTACGGDDSSDNGGSGEAASTVTDMNGDEVELPDDPQSIVATDNNIFETLAEWDVELTAAPVDLMPDPEMNDVLTTYTENDDILNIGNHREPDLEQIVAADSDLVLNGYRFGDYKEEIEDLVEDGTPVVDTGVDFERNELDVELRNLTEMLGEIFGEQDAADDQIAEFDDAIQRVQDSYNSDETVMGLLTSGGDISYSAPETGRTVGPIFPVLDLTPVEDAELEADDSTHGDDVSVEAIADADPDWMVVLDRDAAVEDDAESADELLHESEALQNVTAVEEDQIIYLAEDFYTAEDIQHYTELFNDMADAFEESEENSDN